MAHEPEAGGSAPPAAAEPSAEEAPSKRKRRIRNNSAPSFPEFTLRLSANLITADDIPSLAEKAGLPLCSEAMAENLAFELHDAFAGAVLAQGASTERPALQEVEDFLAKVEAQALALLTTLREPHNTEGVGPAVAAHWFYHMQPGLRGPEPPAFWSVMADGPHRDLYSKVAVDTLASLPADADADARRAAYRRAGSRAMLKAAPTVLRTLAAVAIEARQVQAELPRRQGHRPNVFLHMLFDRLVYLHKAMFGVAPVTRDADAMREGRSIDWAIAAIKLANNRAKAAMPDLDAASLKPLADAARLSKVRIADLLERARSNSNRRRHP